MLNKNVTQSMSRCFDCNNSNRK